MLMSELQALARYALKINEQAACTHEGGATINEQDASTREPLSCPRLPCGEL